MEEQQRDMLTATVHMRAQLRVLAQQRALIMSSSSSPVSPFRKQQEQSLSSPSSSSPKAFPISPRLETSPRSDDVATLGGKESREVSGDVKVDYFGFVENEPKSSALPSAMSKPHSSFLPKQRKTVRLVESPDTSPRAASSSSLVKVNPRINSSHPSEYQQQKDPDVLSDSGGSQSSYYASQRKQQQQQQYIPTSPTAAASGASATTRHISDNSPLLLSSIVSRRPTSAAAAQRRRRLKTGKLLTLQEGDWGFA